MYFNPRSLTGATTISHFALVYCHDFNPRSLTGATAGMIDTAGRRVNFNPRSLTGATYGYNTVGAVTFISIHAPSRERPSACVRNILLHIYFNPRSLTGATEQATADITTVAISIHAPSRERQDIYAKKGKDWEISIHAPSRERLIFGHILNPSHNFNPRSLTGATHADGAAGERGRYFNPRSLTGATDHTTELLLIASISIHAPSRERPR